MKEHYTFGDNDAAADRLTLLARAFEPSSADLLERLERSWPSRASRVVDLGCGPGYTTTLVHNALGARETWGLDASERLITRARSRVSRREAQDRHEEREGAAARGTGGTIEFAVHDVTASPFPVSGIDVFYARYLFTHLARPHAVLEACAAAAARSSRLVIEDNCALESGDPLFAAYYERVRTMHAHYGQDMFIGSRLPRIAEGSPWALDRFDRTAIALDGRVMAQLHAINVRTWRNDPFASTAFDAAEIDAMARDLEDVASGVRDAPQVVCTMGQAVLRR